MPQPTPDKYIGVYKGTPIRRKQPENLISATDLHKANGSPTTHRPDRWIKSPEAQKLLAAIAKKNKLQTQVDLTGNIIGLPSVLEVLRGGDRFFQGTFFSLDVAVAYAQSLSDECLKWLKTAINSDKASKVMKAKREPIPLGSMTLYVFQLPDGSYKLSQTQCADVIEKTEVSFRDFLGSKSPEVLPYKGFEAEKFPYEGGNSRIALIPIALAVAYWTKEAGIGNSIAAKLLGACAIETIERRADKVFGVSRTEEQYNQRFIHAFESFATQVPDANFLTKTPFKEESSQIRVSSPFYPFYSEISRKLKKEYKDGGIPGVSKEVLRDKIALLASYSTNSWKLTLGQELNLTLHKARHKYPDLVSETFIFNLSENRQKARLLIQVFDLIVDFDDIEECVLKRRYIQLAKETFQTDYIFMFFVAPFGATPDALNFIETSLPDDIKGYVGVLTVKELHGIYYEQITKTKHGSRIKADLTRKFKILSDYRIPNSKVDFFSESTEPIQLSLFDDFQSA